MSRYGARPRLARLFYKGHGLGNDYLVFEEGADWTPSPINVERVCDPHVGVGADGVVALLADRTGGVFRLRMFNPDGGEFERSGNGLRVLGSYLARLGAPTPYRVQVGGEEVVLALHPSLPGTYDVEVAMGRARTGAAAVGLDPAALGDVASAPGSVTIEGPDGEGLVVVPVSVGNPHLVVLSAEVSQAGLTRVGPFLVGHPSLAHGANVQLATTAGPGRCRALIWERGVGPTSASGTSACAVAVAMVSTGRLPPGDIAVDMPGGTLSVRVSEDFDVTLRGPIEEVCEGALATGLLRALATDA